MSLGTLSMTTGNGAGLVLPFLTFATPTGWLVDQYAVDEEELRSPGVDGRRYRTESQQFPPFTAETIADADSYAAAIARARQYLRTQGGYGDLAVTIDGTEYRIRRVHVLHVAPRCQPGKVVGAGASAAAAASVLGAWTFQPLEFPA
jgi:hypothetical protein